MSEYSSLPTSPSVSEATYRFDFEFRGTTMEFFRIWVVNVALSLLTLGIYSAWAKVRTKRYFYANTYLDGANFEYHASPVSILISRIIVLLILAAIIVLLAPGMFGDSSGYLQTLALLVFLPWAWVRGLSFNARNSSYRNVRFAFQRAYGFPYLLCFLLFTGVGGLILLPWLVRNYHAYKAERHRFGSVFFSFNRESYWSYASHIIVYFVFISLIIGLITGLMIFLSEGFFPEDGYSTTIPFISLLFWGIVYFMLLARFFILFWSNVRTSSGAAFKCDFSTSEFGMVLLTNFLAIVISLGLLMPWAKVRKTKFLTERMTLVAPAGALDEVIARHSTDESALGEELDTAEGFDFDVGIF